MKMRVGIVFGGRSGEHEISIRSAMTVIEQIDKEKYEVVPIAITNTGQWLGPAESARLLPASARETVEDPAGTLENGSIVLISSDVNSGFSTLPTEGEAHKGLDLDVIFPVLHGTFGEDGTIQGVFEMAGIPYVGCGVLASACGMDKVIMKSLFREAEIPICRHVWFLRHEWESDPWSVIKQIESKLGYPCFAKPANLGSSVGVSRAADTDSLKSAINIAALYDRKVIVEEGLDMREIEVAVMGNDEPVASMPGEYIIQTEDKKFLDYTEKYSGTGNNEFVVPAPVSDELNEKIRKLAIRAYKAIDASGLARVDFFLRADTGALLVNEINTLPGLTDASGFPKMWNGSGKPFPEVIDKLIELAVERHKDRGRNRTELNSN